MEAYITSNFNPKITMLESCGVPKSSEIHQVCIFGLVDVPYETHLIIPDLLLIPADLVHLPGQT